MPVQRMCKSCGKSIIVWSSLQTRCPKCQIARSKAKPPKAIRMVGKETERYNKWRDLIAIPYLTNRFGYKCDHCGVSPEHLDVAHKKTRGAHHELKFDVKNVRFLCRDCHRKETDGKL